MNRRGFIGSTIAALASMSVPKLAASMAWIRPSGPALTPHFKIRYPSIKRRWDCPGKYTATLRDVLGQEMRIKPHDEHRTPNDAGSTKRVPLASTQRNVAHDQS